MRLSRRFSCGGFTVVERDDGSFMMRHVDDKGMEWNTMQPNKVSAVLWCACAAEGIEEFIEVEKAFKKLSKMPFEHYTSEYIEELRVILGEKVEG